MDNYKLTSINNFLDAMEVRKIRNECRSFMTNYTSEISIPKQIIWYFKTYKKENKENNMTCFLFNLNNQNLGFALMRKNDGKYWITGGLRVKERGKGIGKILFTQLLKKIPSKDIWLEVLDTNISAKKIYNNLGFKKIEEKEVNGKKVVIMRLIKS